MAGENLEGLGPHEGQLFAQLRQCLQFLALARAQKPFVIAVHQIREAVVGFGRKMQVFERLNPIQRCNNNRTHTKNVDDPPAAVEPVTPISRLNIRSHFVTSSAISALGSSGRLRVRWSKGSGGMTAELAICSRPRHTYLSVKH